MFGKICNYFIDYLVFTLLLDSQRGASESCIKMNKIKAGNLLRYKKRIFGSNWKLNHLTLYKYGSLLIQSYSSSSQTWIKCDKNSTLIVFGKDINSVPKRPELPSGYDNDQLLAIGVMMEEKSGSFTSIIFYWFLTENLDDLFDWIVAFRTSLIPRPWPSEYEKEERERQEKEAEEAGLGILMAGAGYQAITGCEVATDFNDYTFTNDFSFCAGL